MSKLLPEGTYVGYPVGGAPPGPLKPPQGPRGGPPKGVPHLGTPQQ